MRRYRRSYRRRRIRRTYRRRRGYGRRFRRYRRGRRLPVLGGFPKKRLIRLKFTQEFLLDATDLLIAQKSFRANCIRDPQFAVGGRSPSNFDEIMAHYENFVVIGSKCKCRCFQPGLSNVQPGYWGIIMTNRGDSITVGDLDTLREHVDNSRTKQMPQFTNSAPNQITRKWSGRKYFGKNFSVSNPNFMGSASASPFSETFYIVWASNTGGNNPGAFTFLIEIEYLAVLIERRVFN